MMPYTLGLSVAATIMWIMLPTKTRSYDILVNLWRKMANIKDETETPKVECKAEEVTETSVPVSEEKSTIR